MKFLKRCLAPLSLFLFLLCAASPSHAQTSQIPQQCKDTSGSATTQVCSTTLTLGPVKGDEIIYSTTTTNTGDLTVNVDGTGAAHIKKWSGSATLAAGDIVANTPVELIFDGAGFWEVQTIGNAPGAGSVTTSGSPASGYCTYFSGSTVIIGTANCTLNSSGNMVLAGTLTAGPSVATTSDGVHAAYFYAVGNTTLPVSLPSNAFGIIGPPSASFTSYFLQPPATAPSNTDPYLSCPTPSGGVSVCSWATGGSGAGPSFTTPISVAPSSGTTTSAIINPENTTGLPQQPCSNFTSSAAASITCVFPNNLAVNDDYLVTISWPSNTITISSTTSALGGTITAVGGGPIVSGTSFSSETFNVHIGTAGAETFTANFSTNTTATASGTDYTGIATSSPLDTPTLGAGSSGTAVSSGSITTTNANDLLVCTIATKFFSSFTLGSGFSMQQQNPNNNPIVISSELVSSTGTPACTGTLSNYEAWTAQLTALKLTAAPAVAPILSEQSPEAYPWLYGDLWGNFYAKNFSTNAALAAAGAGGLSGAINLGINESICAVSSPTTPTLNCITMSPNSVSLTASLFEAPNGVFTGNAKASSFSTQSNCTSTASPAVCGSSPAGSFVIAAGATSVVVDTSAMTANSQVFIQEDSSLGTKLGVTCNTAAIATTGAPEVTARTGGTSFTVNITTGPTTNPACYSYFIVN